MSLARIALLLLAGVVPAAAAAQQPTPDQLAALRSNCRSDYIEHCSSVSPGGTASIRCLQQNEAMLQPACRAAVAVVAGRSSGAAVPAPMEPAAPGTSGDRPVQEVRPAELFRDECGPDIRRLCHMLMPGGGRVIGCLIENREQLSPQCRTAMIELRERR